jgi:hypothetical protein
MNFTFASFEGTKREREEEYLSIDWSFCVINETMKKEKEPLSIFYLWLHQTIHVLLLFYFDFFLKDTSWLLGLQSKKAMLSFSWLLKQMQDLSKC